MGASDDACRHDYYNISTARSAMDVCALVNPLSGAGANPDLAGERVALLMQRFVAAGITGTVYLTERRGHAADLARAAIAQGARTVLAWGGDGTINEIGGLGAGDGNCARIRADGWGEGLSSGIRPALPPAG